MYIYIYISLNLQKMYLRIIRTFLCNNVTYGIITYYT